MVFSRMKKKRINHPDEQQINKKQAVMQKNKPDEMNDPSAVFRKETVQNHKLPLQTVVEGGERNIPNPGNTSSTKKGISQFASYKSPDSGYDQENQTLVGSFLSLFHHVSLKKKLVNNQTYYALSIETPDIKINKTFKSLTER